MRRFVLILGALISLAAGGPAAAAASPQSVLSSALTQGMNNAGGAGGAYVQDLSTGKTLFSWVANTGRLPASVEKLYTTSTALLRFGPNGTLATRVLAAGTLDRHHGFHGILWLKGGGDPTFGSASFDQSAYGTGATIGQLADNLIRNTQIKSIQGRIVGDDHVLRLESRHSGDRQPARPDRCRGAARWARLRPRLRQLSGHGRAAAAGAVRDPAVRRRAPGAWRQDRLEHRCLHGSGAEECPVARHRALPFDRDADPTYQHAVGQLLRGDAAEGSRREVRRGRDDGRGRRGGPIGARGRVRASTRSSMTAPGSRARTTRARSRS